MREKHNSLDTAPSCLWGSVSRRAFLKQSLIAAALPTAVYSKIVHSATSSIIPREPTSIGLCKRYDYPLVRRTLAHMLDELGTVRSLVKGKYVTVKVNLVNTSKEDVGGVPLSLTVTTHPNVALALGSLFIDYGARHVTFCDQLPFLEPGPESFAGYGYDCAEFTQEMEGRVEFVNTRNRGTYKQYDLVKVPDGGEIASAWEVNQTYTKTDVFVSLGKLKNHVAGGVTMGMKNLIGVPPSSLYGDDLKDEPDENAIGYRSDTMHTCTKLPRTSVATYTGRHVLKDHGFNIPRLIVDLAGAFPIDLTVVDGISAIQTAEGWWNGSMVSVGSPGLLIAGRNPVCADAVATAVMGFDPDAQDRTHPFANGTNYLAMARKKGMGENRITELEVTGIGLEKARFNYLPTYQRING